MNFVEQMTDHANRVAPEECCGLVVSTGPSKWRLIEAKNLSLNPRQDFEIDTEAFMEIADDEKLIGIYHSHPMGDPNASVADKTSCEATGLPWHIVTPAGAYTCTQPSGFRAPYLGRPYVHGVHDCFSICRDWLNWEMGIVVADVSREDEWWNKGQNLYLDGLEANGFEVVTGKVQIGDIFLMQIRSPVPNHAAVYIGNGQIIQHCQDRLSSKDIYGGMWEKHTTHQLRHKSRIAHG